MMIGIYEIVKIYEELRIDPKLLFDFSKIQILSRAYLGTVGDCFPDFRENPSELNKYKEFGCLTENLDDDADDFYDLDKSGQYLYIPTGTTLSITKFDARMQECVFEKGGMAIDYIISQENPGEDSDGNSGSFDISVELTDFGEKLYRVKAAFGYTRLKEAYDALRYFADLFKIYDFSQS